MIFMSNVIEANLSAIYTYPINISCNDKQITQCRLAESEIDPVLSYAILKHSFFRVQDRSELRILINVLSRERVSLMPFILA